MGLTHFPNGVSSFGIPVLPGSEGQNIHSGNAWFVSSVDGSDGNTGKEPAQAVATLDKALSLATADNGDVIYVCEGHAETIAASQPIDVVGVAVIGLGHGRTRPTFTFSATASNFLMSSADCRLSNLVFKAGIAAIVKGITITADDCQVDNCELSGGDTTAYCFLCGIGIGGGAGVKRAKVLNNHIIAEDSKVAAKTGIKWSTADYTEVRGNRITGAFATSLIYSHGTVSRNIVVDSNIGRNDNATYGRGIQLSVADVGIVAYNRYTTALSAGTAIDSSFDPGACGCVENYVSREASGGLAGDRNAFAVPMAGRLNDWHTTYADCTAFAGLTTNKRGDDGGTSDRYDIFGVKGMCEIKHVLGYCGTSIGGNSTATLSVGVTGATGIFVAKVANAGIDAGDFVYRNAINVAAPSLTGVPVTLKDKTIAEYVHADNIGTGYLDYVCIWRPLMPGSEVRSAV